MSRQDKQGLALIAACLVALTGFFGFAYHHDYVERYELRSDYYTLEADISFLECKRSQRMVSQWTKGHNVPTCVKVS